MKRDYLAEMQYGIAQTWMLAGAGMGFVIVPMLFVVFPFYAILGSHGPTMGSQTAKHIGFLGAFAPDLVAGALIAGVTFAAGGYLFGTCLWLKEDGIDDILDWRQIRGNHDRNMTWARYCAMGSEVRPTIFGVLTSTVVVSAVSYVIWVLLGGWGSNVLLAVTSGDKSPG